METNVFFGSGKIDQYAFQLERGHTIANHLLGFRHYSPNRLPELSQNRLRFHWEIGGVSVDAGSGGLHDC